MEFVMAHNTGVDISASNPLPVAVSKRIDQTTTTKAVQPPVEASEDHTTKKPGSLRENHEFHVIFKTHAEATSLEERAFIIRSMRALLKHVHSLAHKALETSDAERKAAFQARAEEQIAAVAAAASSESARVSEALAATAVETTNVSTKKGAMSAINNIDRAQAMLSESEVEVGRAQKDLIPTAHAALNAEVDKARQQIENLGSLAIRAATTGIRDSASSLIG